jgi:dihydroorotate dehydrogenase
MYKKLIKPILFLTNPEKVHNFFVKTGQFLGKTQIGRSFISLFYKYNGKDISKKVDGIFYKTPVLLSAGFDYNGKLTQILSSLSFGGEEVGSVTAKKCLGNKKPRLSRLKNTKSIIVNKGLRNDGVDSIISRLKKKKRINDFVIGISIARTNSLDCDTIELGIEDYFYSLDRLNSSNICDFYTINISCPNAYCGETFTEPKYLEQLFNKLDTLKIKKPVYVKMPISVSNEIFFELIEILSKHNVNGVVIGNLQKNYDFINKLDKKPNTYRGGLSGKPCENRSNYLIKMTKEKWGNRFTIIGCGGIFSYEDAKKKFLAGADLIQLVTGMIYEGPGLIKKICLELEKEKYKK